MNKALKYLTYTLFLVSAIIAIIFLFTNDGGGQMVGPVAMTAVKVSYPFTLTGKNSYHDCPPLKDCPQCQPDFRNRQRPYRRAGQARRPC